MTEPSPCTRADHDALTADDARWEAECLRHRAWPDTWLEVAECRRCHSTLARRVPWVMTVTEDHWDRIETAATAA